MFAPIRMMNILIAPQSILPLLGNSSHHPSHTPTCIPRHCLKTNRNKPEFTIFPVTMGACEPFHFGFLGLNYKNLQSLLERLWLKQKKQKKFFKWFFTNTLLIASSKPSDALRLFANPCAIYTTICLVVWHASPSKTNKIQENSKEAKNVFGPFSKHRGEKSICFSLKPLKAFFPMEKGMPGTARHSNGPSFC